MAQAERQFTNARATASNPNTVRTANTNARPNIGNVRVIRSGNTNNTLPASVNPTRKRVSEQSYYTDAPKNSNLHQTDADRFVEENYNRINSTLVGANDTAAPNRDTRATNQDSSFEIQNAEAIYNERQQQEVKKVAAGQVVMQKKLEAQKAAKAEAEAEISVPGLVPHRHISRALGFQAALSVNGALFNPWMLILVPMGLLNLFAYGLMSTTPEWIDKTIDWLGLTYIDSQNLFGITFAVQFAAIITCILIAGTMLKFRGIHPLHGTQGSGFKQLTFLLSIIVCFFPGGALLPVFMIWVFTAGVNPN